MNYNMRILLLCRDSLVSRYIAHKLVENNMLDAIIVEKASRANRRNLHRVFKRARWYQYPLILCDLAALYFYCRITTRYVSRNFPYPEQIRTFPKGIRAKYIQDINSSQCCKAIAEHTPELIFVSGTSILKGDTVTLAERYILNVHGGIVPEYRNVHSDFWAFYRRDCDNIGITVMHLDEGIDTGAIALQKRVTDVINDSLGRIKVKLILLAGDCAVDAAELAVSGKLPRIEQRDEKSARYTRPGCSSIVKALMRHVVRRTR